MNAIAPISAVTASPQSMDFTRPVVGSTSPWSAPTDVKAAFQDAVGSLFFGQMIKALRSGVGKPAYLHGGQAEEMFQAQMDQKVAESLARHNGGALVEELYQRFLVDHPESNVKPPSELASLSQTVKSAPTVESAQQASWARFSTSGAQNTTGTGVISALYRK